MLKTTRSPNKPALSSNDNSSLASNRIVKCKLAFRRNNRNSEVDDGDNVEHTKKSEKSKKLPKSQKSKGKKLKKSLKSRNPLKIAAKKAGPTSLTFRARIAFNYLRLTFTKAPIL